jgi:hypothetical protein
VLTLKNALRQALLLLRKALSVLESLVLLWCLAMAKDPAMCLY